MSSLFARSWSRPGAVVNRPFTSWVKVYGVVDASTANQYHAAAVEDAATSKP